MLNFRKAGQVTDNNTAHAHFMLYNKGYKHIITTCYSYWFFTATIVEKTRVIVTLYQGADKSLGRTGRK